MLRKITIYLSIYLLSLSVHSQKVIYPHNVFWSKIELNQLDKNLKFGLGLDFVYRRKSGLEDNNMFSERLRESIRPWLHYQFSPYSRFSLSPIGYMFTNEYLGKPSDLNRLPYHELRTTFQFFHHTKQLNGRIMHTWRYRYELRWQDNPLTDEYRFFTRFRFRYRIRILLNSNDFYKDKTAYLSFSNEIGLNLGKNVVLNTFNQNRLYLGVGYRMFNVMRVELRYVNRIRTRGATGFEFDNGQGIMIGIYFDALKGFGKKDDEYKIQFTD
jgi:hypothetical protein